MTFLEEVVNETEWNTAFWIVSARYLLAHTTILAYLWAISVLGVKMAGKEHIWIKMKKRLSGCSRLLYLGSRVTSQGNWEGCQPISRHKQASIPTHIHAN